MKKILLAVALVSTVSFISCNSGGGDNPKVVVSKFFEALSKKDIATARKLATKESKSIIDMMEFGMSMSKDIKVTDKFSTEKIEFGEPKISGNEATVSVKEKGTENSRDLILKREDGSWKVAFDMASIINIGMQKMKNEGQNSTENLNKAMEELKNVNIDSLKEEVSESMRRLDSIKKAAEAKTN